MKKVVCIIIALMVSQAGFAADSVKFPYVVSVGNSEREVPPDMALIRLRVTAFDPESALALEQANKATAEVLKVIQEYGVSPEKVEASDLAKSTTRRRDSRNNRLEILGYEVSRSMSIKLTELAKYSEIMSDLVAINNVAGANTEFDISNRKEIEAMLIETASKDARSKAERMSESLGTKIQSVLAISQSASFEELTAEFGLASSHYPNLATGGADYYRAAMFVPSTIMIKQRINVVFRIE